MKRCRASGLRVEQQRDFGLGATGQRLLACLARLKHWPNSGNAANDRKVYN